MIIRLFAILSLVLAAPAFAEDAATVVAKRHFDRGEKLFALGKFDDALDEYQKAFDAKQIPDFLFNIGQCYRNLGDYQQAAFSFRKYLKLEPDAPDRDKVEKLIDELEEKHERGEGQRLIQPPPPPPLPPPTAKTESTPFYKQWWFWAGVGVVGVAGGFGAYEASKGGGPPDTSLHRNIVFGK
jgi:tetratricopeptide (TPR) repeat protein